MNFRTLVFASVLIISGAWRLAAEELYTQAPFNAGGIASSVGGVALADQFLLRTAASVTAVRWYGVLSPDAAISSGGDAKRLVFSISFFEDGAGLPKELRYQEAVPVVARDTTIETPFLSGRGHIYEFTADLPKPFAVEKDKISWLSIASAEPTSLSWLWSRSPATSSDTLAFRRNGPTDPIDWRSNGQYGQLAFTLISGVAPESGIPPLPALPKQEPSNTNGAPPGFRAEPGVTAPKPIRNPNPSYSDAGRIARVSGTVRLDCIVHIDGTVSVLRINQGIGFGLDDSAISTLEKWRLEPARRNGEPFDTVVTMEVSFKLL